MSDFEDPKEDSSQESLVHSKNSMESMQITPVAEDKQSLKAFKHLSGHEKPLMPLPPDNMGDIQYSQRMEMKCGLCTSPFRNIAERYYLEQSRNVNAVVRYFKDYYGAKIVWETVATHMTHHCDFRRVSFSGLKTISLREDEVRNWKGNEYDLVLTMYLLEIDDVKGLDCSKNPELALKRSSMLERLGKDVLALAKQRDDAGTQELNIFAILRDLYDACRCEADRAMIAAKVEEIRLKLAEAG